MEINHNFSSIQQAAGQIPAPAFSANLLVRFERRDDGGNCLRYFAASGRPLYYQYSPDIYGLYFWVWRPWVFRDFFQKKVWFDKRLYSWYTLYGFPVKDIHFAMPRAYALISLPYPASEETAPSGH